MKSNSMLLAVLIFAAVALISIGAWIYIAQMAPNPVPVAQNNQEAQENLSPVAEEAKPERQSQIDDEAAGWKTYRNEEYGFEIKYPNNLYMDNPCDDIVCFVGDEWSDVSSIGSSHYSDISVEFVNSELSPKMLINDKGTETSMPEIDAYVLKFKNNFSVEEEKRILECVNETRDCQYFAVKDRQEAFIGTDKIPAFLFNNGLTSGKMDNAMVQLDDNEILNIKRNISTSYPEKNIPKEIYDQMLSTIKFIDLDVKKEIVSEANFGQMLAYIERTTLTGKKHFQHYPEKFESYFYRLVLKKDNNEKTLDTSMGNNMDDVFNDHFANVKFSPGGRYLIVRSHLWEASRDYLYNLVSEKKVFDDRFLQMAWTTEFTPDEKYFYSCGAAGIDGTNMFKIISIPDMELKCSEDDKTKRVFYEQINCGYDPKKEIIYFDFIDSRQALDKRIEFSTITGEII